ncbi:MAG: arginine--tRNA ligase [Firmicutes bacterium]|nr:arginine--tRNA ligase [Bacillota bacterium]
MIEMIKLELRMFLEKELSRIYLMPISMVVEEPKKAGQGDISVPVFSVVNTLKKPLLLISKEIRDLIKISPFKNLFSEVNIMGGFVNLVLNKQVYALNVIEHFKKNQENYGNNVFGNGKTIVMDYSSPNIAKPFSIGHLRSTIIGHSIGNILEKCGYKVYRINHLGDFGTQFGKIIYAYLNFGSEAAVKANPIEELVKLYVEFHELAKNDPSLEEKAREIFKELEQNNPKYVALWTWFREESLKDYMEVYKLLQVDFDSFNGEAFYNDKMQKVIDELKEKELLKLDQGAMIVDLGEDFPPALIQKSDGSTLYITRDLAALFYRKNTYHFDKALYIVGNEQKLHFTQIQKVIELMGYEFKDDIVHVNFGLVLQDGKKMSTRKGKIVRLMDVLQEAIHLSLLYINEKNPTLENKELIAEKIGVSAIIFNDLKNYRANDFEFNLEEMVNFVGQTGPYLQYTSVRITSILQSDAFVFDGEIDASLFEKDHYFEIMKQASQYPDIIAKAASEYAPSVLAKYLLNLASLFNSFYGREKIIVEDLLEKNTKMHLLYIVRNILNDGMVTLGMQVIEKM